MEHYQEYRERMNDMANIARELRRDSRDKNGKVIELHLKPLISFLQDVDDTMEKINKEQPEKELRKKARDAHEIYSNAQRRKQSIQNRNRYIQQRRNRTTN